MNKLSGSMFARGISLLLLISFNLVPFSMVAAQTADNPPAVDGSGQTSGTAQTSSMPAPQTSAPTTDSQSGTASAPSTGDSATVSQPAASQASAPASDAQSTDASVSSGPDTAFSSPSTLAKYSPQERAAASKFDFSPSSMALIASNKWLNSYEYANHLPETTSMSGAFTYDVPLFSPPGRNGVQPDLRLTYNSQDKSNDTIVGFGWSLNIPYIERINKNGIGNLYSNYNFTSSLDGELSTSTALTTSIYRARFDDGTMRQYTFATSTNTWMMVDKSGTQYIFGSSTTARLYDYYGTTSHVALWMLEKVIDTNGNSMVYTYTQDLINSGRQIYPATITYTTNGSSTPAFEADFIIATRPYDYRSYKYGFETDTYKHITEIDAKFNGNLVNKYVLGYTTGFNQNRDLLQTITQTGYDESNNPVTLPATTFAYQTQNTTWATSTPANAPPAFVDSNGRDLGYRFFHWKRGNTTDAIHLSPFYRSGYEAADWSNLGTQINNIPTLVDDSNNDIGSAIVDVNGDGFPDIIQGKVGSYNDIYLWTNGGSYVSASTTMSNVPVLVDTNGNDLGVRFGDFNGDGYEDYIISTTTGAVLYLNKADGTGWANAGPISGLPSFIDASGNDNGTRVMDINGDGIDDIVKFASSDAHGLAYLNTGDGLHWNEAVAIESSIPIITGGPNGPGGNAGTSIVDVDGDGLSDFVVSTPNRGTHFYINTGYGWVDRPISSIPYFLDSADAKDIGTRIIDGSADTLPDFVTSNASTSADYLSSGDPVDVLTSITIPAGGVSTITYQGTRVDVSTLRTVKTVTNDPGLGGATMSKTYGYLYGEFLSTFQDRKFAGFARVDTTDSLGNRTQTYYHQGNGNNVNDPNELWDSYALGEYNDIEAKMYKPYRVDALDNGWHTYTTTITKWDSKDAGNGTTLVFPADTLAMSYDGLSTHRDAASLYDYATSSGNLITKTEYGEVTGNTNGTFTDLSANDNRLTTYAYASPTASSSNQYLLGLPYLQTLSDYLGNKISETRTYYDNLSLGSVAAGNATRQEFLKTGSSYASTTKTYNAFGLVTQSTDARGNTTTNTYDPFNLYVATSTNPLGQTTAYLYNYAYGKPKQTTDANGFVYQTVFDGLGRSVQEKEPDLMTPSTLVTKNAYAYTDTALNVAIQQTSYLNGATSTNTYTYKDGLNRTIQTRSNAQAASTYVVKDAVYDSRGLLQQETLPYFATGSARASATTTPALFVSYTYDPLSRMTKTTNAVGSTTNAYANWKVTTIDADGKIKDAVKDGFGNLVTVIEHNAGTTATTTYAWDQMNDLINSTDSLGNVRNFTYDGLGRQLTAQDLHATGDGTYGTWNYAYDDANNLIQQVDPKSQTVNYTYDALNRPLTEDYTGQAGTEITYGYDSCLNGKSKLCAATTSDAVVNFTYNANGGLASEKKTISNIAYTTAYNYDRQGNLASVTYPDSSIVNYSYDNNGFLSSVSRKAANASLFATAVSQMQYAPTGALMSEVFGNGAMSTYTYDPSQIYRLTQILTVASSTVSGNGGGLGSLGMIAGSGAPLAMVSGGSPIALSSVQSLASFAPSSLNLAAQSSVPLAQADAQYLAMQSLDAGSLGATNTDMVATSSQDIAATAMPVNLPVDAMLDGKLRRIDATDDNTGEDLLISTDQRTYTGLSEATVYFTVQNTTTFAQTVNLNFLFDNANKGATKIERLNVTQKDVPVFSQVCSQMMLATSTKNKSATVCSMQQTSTVSETVEQGGSTPLSMAPYDDSAVQQALTRFGKVRKNVSGYVAQHSAQDVLQPGARAYYKATIAFDVGSRGEFFIEAIGNNGGYGHLDPWYSSNWMYRKQLTINGATGAGTNYQVLLKVGESASSTGAQFSLGAHSSSFPTGQGQGGDFAFADGDGSTQLNFWVEDVTGTAPNRVAYVWVKVPDNLGSTQKIYLYYGNASASNLSNGSGTFNLFDGFDGSSVDGSKWTTICNSGCNITNGTYSSITESGGVLTQADQSQSGSGSRIVATTTPIDTSGYAVARRFERLNTGTYANTTLDFNTDVSTTNGATTTPGIYQNHNQQKASLQSTALTTLTMYSTDLSQNTWYREEARRVSANVVEGTLWDNTHNILGTDEHNVSLSQSVGDTEYPSMRSGDGFSTATDWLFVRKYVATEPAFSSAATEERLASLQGWNYRRKLTLGGSTGAGTNYPVAIKIGESGGASGDLFDLGGHSAAFPTGKNDGGDLRFTDSTGTSTLNFWVESVSGSAPNRTALVWVKVAGDLGTNKDIYLYYGNSSASSTSNGSATFSFFDDFNGTSLNPSVWSAYTAGGATIAVSGGVVTQTDTQAGGVKSLFVASTTGYSTGYAFRQRAERTANGTYATMNAGLTSFDSALTSGDVGGTSTREYWNNSQNAVKLSSRNATDVVVRNSGLTQNTWYRFETRRVSNASSSALLWDDSTSLLGSNSQGISPVFSDTLYPFSRSADLSSNVTDWMLVRKYVYPEPAPIIVGSEENVSVIPSTYVPVLQSISYTYDPAGNITQITDNSQTGAGKTVTFAYDDLQRLISASTTAASTTPYTETYSYNPIGDLTSKTGIGTYTYAGTGYANPHAPTTIGSVTYTYDNNGNLVSASPWTYAWDYRNRIISAGNGSATSTYAYDFQNNRIRQFAGGATTTYANKYWSITGATSTAYIYAGNTLIAAIDGTGLATTTRYIHPDLLNSTNAVTDANSNLTQVLDYYPYGSIRLNTSYNGVNEKHKYIGQYYDDASNLDYLNARYYDSNRGQFLSEDPVFWKKPSITDPQSLNAYSYARNNPIRLSDPSGLITSEQQIQLLQAQVKALQGIVSLYQSGQTAKANTVFASYQGITGGSDYQSLMSSVNTTGDVVQAYSQGSGIANQVVNNVVSPTGAYVAGGIGVAAGGGAGLLYAAGALGLTESAVSGCIAFCDKADRATSFFEGVTNLGDPATHVDPFHTFPTSVAAFEDAGTVTTSANADGSIYHLLEIPGSYPNASNEWYDGVFQVGKVGDQIVHWQFKPL